MRRAGALVAVLAVLVTAGCGGSDDPVLGDGAAATSSSSSALPATTATTDPTGAIDGVEVYAITDVDHTAGTVDYDPVPPVAGNHAAVWQNCGFYAEPVSSEAAVHSLEHGAVWVTYRTDLPENEVETLRALTSNTYILVSPWGGDDLPAPVVASAWNRQLRLETADDPRLTAFVTAFRSGRQSPEPGAPCTGGTGTPT